MLGTADYVQINDTPWMPFPEAFSNGGIRWKLLHVSPEDRKSTRLNSSH